MVSYTVSHQAYVKIILHSAKYPHKLVNGVLLGKRVGSDQVAIDDAVPLLHNWTSLSPMMEIGLDLASGYAESKGLHVVGYYQASERVGEVALAPVGERMASKISEAFPEAIALVVDGQQVGSESAALMPFVAASGTSWRPVSSSPPPFTLGSTFSLVSEKSPTRAVALIRESRLHEKFGDFDDHLEDVSIDWLRNEACNDPVP
ncbi:UPF0172-domain-containing protein [Gloeophyllum trabeum ATCC 11539]|uniref:UPF0172-domain-containing protein n=1 Tax=Gloeophyllum trabeum (strain ATCC 11539 / FP-39264 / Madison 617) TaxID=670483 RepID=S7Q3L1_GLOTA|nr:UPF0172-domain-containing protein [Gloeophyllum trabeum ATCC 11539]EPQ54571.1 UPF0172-domain-containing protein [Gloeophyllum trabeum ATCC 11539]